MGISMIFDGIAGGSGGNRDCGRTDAGSTGGLDDLVLDIYDFDDENRELMKKRTDAPTNLKLSTRGS